MIFKPCSTVDLSITFFKTSSDWVYVSNAIAYVILILSPFLFPYIYVLFLLLISFHCSGMAILNEPLSKLLAKAGSASPKHIASIHIPMFFTLFPYQRCFHQQHLRKFLIYETFVRNMKIVVKLFDHAQR